VRVLDDALISTSASAEKAASSLVEVADLERFWPPALATSLETIALARARTQVLGDGPRWLQAIAALGTWGPQPLTSDRAAPALGLEHARPADVVAALQALCPWRKGPFEILGVHLDAEWRCDLKWARVQSAVAFEGKRVLDVGCGNGYYLLRALGAGARAALGVDPTWLYVAQFRALRALFAGLEATSRERPVLPAWVLPLGVEDVPLSEVRAEVVLSMGVLYHRKSPIEHLEQLKAALAPGGTLVLESLIVPGDERTVLVPASRYAQMRNVWMIPSVDALGLWLARVGFSHVEVVDVSTTSTEEQRPTPFMNSLSLEHFLDPNDNELTVEGYPRPRRAVVVARR
jgi:tRNA (mo5U34)-methyltransferase